MHPARVSTKIYAPTFETSLSSHQAMLMRNNRGGSCEHVQNTNSLVYREEEEEEEEETRDRKMDSTIST